MKRYLLPLLLCFVSFAYAQTANQPFLFKHFDAEITTASSQTSDGKYYQPIPIPFAVGDMAFIVYRSNDFSVLVGVQDTLGRVSLKQDNKVFDKAKGSQLLLPFRPPFKGNFNFLFSTKDKGATGKFSLDLYLYRKKADWVRKAANASFSDRLNYLLGQKFLGFELVKLAQTEGFMANFTPTVKLFDEADCKIKLFSGSTTYGCTFPAFTDLAAVNKKFEELEAATRSILPAAYGRSKNTEANFSGKAKERFVRDVIFTETGELPFDVDPMQKITGIKHMITISVHKNTVSGEYELTYDLD
nr:hypothetical protein [uncultured Mucilaginibacter sp.]